MYKELLKDKLIELRGPKRPEEMNRSTEPEYCKYHRVLGHPLEKCFAFKEKVINVTRQGSILLEEDKVAANHVTTTIIKPAEVKVLDDFWESKLEPGILWGDYPSDSYHEDLEDSCHVYLEIEDISEVGTTSEAPHATPEISQSFAVTFTDEDVPEEDERMIKANENPFTVEESYFANAKYYQRKKMKEAQPKEVLEAPKGAQQIHLSINEEVIKAPKGLTLPLTQAKKVASTPLKVFVTSVHPTKDAYRGKLPPEGIEDKVHGLNVIQKMLQRKGYAIESSTTGLGYTTM
ncbi:hypothetical protein LIER_23800 [Lithospermum erythrorhizon]|uniref:Uncharacterized protein n=1 Tax=Lithospermum erythrorhizon TaxID=34254 RepID=A0AAV3R2Q5_LITER